MFGIPPSHDRSRTYWRQTGLLDLCDGLPQNLIDTPKNVEQVFWAVILAGQQLSVC